MHIKKLQRIAEERPYLFVIGMFLSETCVAFPFVIAFKLLGIDLEILRLIIPIAQSVFMIWVVWYLGWFTRSGFRRNVKDIHLYWYPVLLAFVPVMAYGTIQISTGPLVFYTVAILFTGISEEILARGVILPALLKKGVWVALFFAASLFSVGHLTNLFFADHDFLKMTEVLIATFGFAVLYGAIFIRTQNILPLILLHTIHDYSLITSGTAGPFVVEPLAIPISIGLAIFNIVYGVYIVMRAK